MNQEHKTAHSVSLMSRNPHFGLPKWLIRCDKSDCSIVVKIPINISFVRLDDFLSAFAEDHWLARGAPFLNCRLMPDLQKYWLIAYSIANDIFRGQACTIAVNIM